MNIGYEISNFFKRNGSTILTFISSAGVVGTAYLASKAAVRAEKELKTLGKEAPLKEKIRTVAPIYIPTAAAGAATIACMFGANTLNRKQQASMLAAGAFIEKSYRKYRQKAEEFLGKNAVEEELAKDDISEGRPETAKEERLFYYNYYEDGDNPEYGSYFTCTIEKLLAAKIEVNRQFILNHQVTLNFFLKQLGLKPVEQGDALGWSEELGSEYFGYSWVDIDHYDTFIDDGPENKVKVTIITTPFPPSILA